LKNNDKIKYIVQTYLYFVRRATVDQITAFLNEGPFSLNSGVTPKEIENILMNSTLFDSKFAQNGKIFVLAR